MWWRTWCLILAGLLGFTATAQPSLATAWPEATNLRSFQRLCGNIGLRGPPDILEASGDELLAFVREQAQRRDLPLWDRDEPCGAPNELTLEIQIVTLSSSPVIGAAVFMVSLTASAPVLTTPEGHALRSVPIWREATLGATPSERITGEILQTTLEYLMTMLGVGWELSRP